MATTKSKQQEILDNNSLDEGQKVVIAREPNALAPMAPPSASDNFLSMVMDAGRDPTVDTTKMRDLYELYKDVKAEDARLQYNQAMSLAQGEMPGIEKRHYNEHTKSYFAKIEDIIRGIKPVWTKHGFSLSFYPADGALDGFLRVCCDVSHSAGDTRHFHYDSPIDTKGMTGKVNKTDTHGRASAMTYGERYLIGLIFVLEVTFVGQDTDGNKEEAHITEEQVEEIEGYIRTNKMDRDAVIELVKAGTGDPQLCSIKAADFKTFMKLLVKKVAK